MKLLPLHQPAPHGAIRKRLRKATFLAATCFALTSSAPAAEVANIGTRLEIFADRWLIEKLSNLDLRIQEPKDEGPVLKFDLPWEGAFSTYSTVIHDGGTYRLYYRGKLGGPDGKDEVTCYAESADGRTWTKPKVGLHEIQGSSDNNVILTTKGVTHNFSPFLDSRPGIPAGERFKALGGIMGSQSTGGLRAFNSGDGVHWISMRDQAVVTKGAFDSQNVAFWSPWENQYVCVMRIFTRGTVNDKAWQPAGLRSMSRASSKDFITWTDPVRMKFKPEQEHHLYTNQTHPYFRAPHLYVATAARFLPKQAGVSDEEAARLGVPPAYYKSARDVSDSVLLTSRDGFTYDQTFREALIRPGTRLSEWVSRSGYPALNVVQTGPTEMSLYVNQDYAQPTAHLRRYSLRLDGFASVHAGYDPGELTTRALRFEGSKLLLNFATSAAGSIRVEIQDEPGAPVPGFSSDECIEILGNAIDRPVSWKSGASLQPLAGKSVRLRFLMKDADLYALRFHP